MTQLTITKARSTAVKFVGPMDSIMAGNPFKDRGLERKKNKIKAMPAMANPIEARKMVVCVAFNLLRLR